MKQARRVFSQGLIMNVRRLLALASALALVIGATMSAQTPPRADPQMQAVLDQLAKLGAKPLETLSPAEARKQPSPADAVMALLKSQGKSTAPEPVANVENKTFPGPAGAVPIRIYTPKGTGPFPVLLYIHGGGWVIADLDTYDASARALTNASGAVLVSTHYRQAPEHKFPGAHDDTWAAYEWVLKNARSFNGDPTKIALAGESAGGNMAAAITVMARDRKLQMPVHQVLVYPVTDHAFDTPSYQENANAKPLSKAAMQWFFGHYLKTPADGDNPRLAVVRTPNLKGLPPATVITAQIDPLRSEGEAFAKKLRAAGVKVHYQNFDGVTHEFFGMGAVVDKARLAVRVAGDQLKAAFNAKP
jgi:acetyl esterase